MNVSFTDKQKKYISSQVDSGDYQNSSEVVREALRFHEYYRNHVIEDIRTKINKGWDGETSKRNVQDIVKDKSS
jgi:antitoxin ParD1/3/4